MEDDPHLAIGKLGKRLSAKGIPSTFFVQAVKEHVIDDYALAEEPTLRRELRALLKSGQHELQLHGSYATIDRDAEFLRKQRLIASAVGRKFMTGHRAHYLRSGGPQDNALYRAAGLKWDASVGFAEREGFRQGTALPTCADGITGFPLHAMDVTLRYRRKLTCDEGFAAIKRVMKEVRLSNGLGTLVWHPHNMDRWLWQEWRDVPFSAAKWAQSEGAELLTLSQAFECWSRHRSELLGGTGWEET
jgi:hypothetical protein